MNKEQKGIRISIFNIDGWSLFGIEIGFVYLKFIIIQKNDKKMRHRL